MIRGTWIAALLIALAGAGWLYSRGAARETSAAAGPQVPPGSPSAVEARAPAALAPPVAASVAPAAPASASIKFSGPLGDASSADLLRKVQLGLGGGSAQEALEAANVLQNCVQATSAAAGLQATRDDPSILPPSVKKFLRSLGGLTNEKLLDGARNDERRCQVFDEATLARRGELFQKAYEGGAPGAAMAYLTWLGNDGKADADPAVVERLQADVRRLAESGDFGTLASFAFMPDAQAYGASRVDREAYKAAWLRIVDDSGAGGSTSSRELIEKLERFSKLPPLTAEQQSDAAALAQKIYDNYHRRSGKRE